MGRIYWCDDDPNSSHLDLRHIVNSKRQTSIRHFSKIQSTMTAALMIQLSCNISEKTIP